MPHAVVAGSDSSLRYAPFIMTQFLRATERPHALTADPVLADRDVIILGGGLAGIAAAVRTLQNGIKPTLVEQRPFLGGRAFSFVDRDTGEEIDNGQHVILGVCGQFLGLLDELGTRDQIDLEPVLDVPVSFRGKISKLRASKLIGNAAALLRYEHLSTSDRLSILRAMLTIKLSRPNQSEIERRKSMSFADWLLDHGKTEAAITRFWSLFILPVFNCSINVVRAHDAIEFTRVALLGRPSNAAIGFSKSGLSTLIGNPAERFLRQRGTELITNIRVETLTALDDDTVEVRLSNSETLRSRAIVSCLTPNMLRRILPNHDPRFTRMRSTLDAIEYSPIVAVHLWYQRPVMTERLTAFIDLGLQWVFNDSALRGNISENSHHIVVSLSGAEEWVSMSKDEILDRVQESMQSAFPRAKGNAIVNSSVVKTLEATIKINAGSATSRIGPSTDLSGLFVAGDWTDTGLPATMEGAVQSGNVAATMAIDALRRGTP